MTSRWNKPGLACLVYFEVGFDFSCDEEALVGEGGDAELALHVVADRAHVDLLVEAPGNLVDDCTLTGVGDALDVGDDLPAFRAFQQVARCSLAAY